MNSPPRLAGRIGITILVASACGSVFCQSASTNAPPAAAVENVVLTVENRVEYARAGSEVWLPAPVGHVLRVKDQLRTGFKSRATVRLSNQSVIRLNQLSMIEIQPPATAEKRSLIDLKKGAAYFYNRETPVETDFHTPLASGAIRGTEFNLSVAEDGRTVLTLLDGQVVLSNELGETNLVSGEMGVVEKGQPPRKTAAVDALNIIQWALYYPGVLDLSELDLSPAENQALSSSLAAYRQGDLLRASAEYPTNRAANSASEQLYAAALSLAVGQVEATEAMLKALPSQDSNPRSSRLAGALRELIATVKHQTYVRASAPTLATEWLAESYYLQSRLRLEAALQAARKTAETSPRFAYAWVRVAELEFSFGRTKEAWAALDRGLELAPRDAEGIALKGYLLAAQTHYDQARVQFDEAIAIDGALSEAWLGRGLCRIRQALNFFSFDLTYRSSREGRQDLQTAALLEPHRAILRSYLAKAFLNEWDMKRATKEVDLAKRLDANDPTAWLYSALLNQQLNRINEGVEDLERSKASNDNRALFRSRMLLDQDRAVRSANLAALYRDAGMSELSAREAEYAVNSDYANYSAHLFLASSYDALRDPKGINLRYDTPWFSELMLANLLAPVGAGTLSQHVSQQEYSPLLERNRLGMSSLTTYNSTGEWFEQGSQFGNLGTSSYAVDTDFHADNGRRPNNDVQALTTTATFKQQVTPQDTLLLQGTYFNASYGDLAQYYNQASGNLTQRVKETQEPLLFLGYQHEWAPGSQTLLLVGRLQDTLTRTDPEAIINFIPATAAGVPTGPLYALDPSKGIIPLPPLGLNYRSDLEAYSAEGQQIWQQGAHTTIAGARYQVGYSTTDSELQRQPGFAFSLAQTADTTLQRASVYAYHQWQVLDPFQIIGGVSYDRLDFPENIDVPPISMTKLNKDQVSPKIGFIFTPFKDTHVRASYTHSLGGAFFDQSVRLEPSQVAGFLQAYRSMIPESVIGLVPGSRFKTADVALDHEWATHTYINIQGELLNSQAEQYPGTFLGTAPIDGAEERLDYEEKSLILTLNQLLAKEWSLGATYRMTHSDLHDQFTSLPAGGAPPAEHLRATIHQFTPYVIFNHRCGFFSEFLATYNRQSNHGYAMDEPGDNFWQFNAFAGYRFLQRRAEVRFGVLNLNGRDYRLNPLTLYAELPRVRTFTASLKLNF